MAAMMLRLIEPVAGRVQRRPSKVKVACVAALALLLVVFRDRGKLLLASEAAHALGIIILINKLGRDGTSAGLSLKTQCLTAMFLAIRLCFSYTMEYDIHTLLDSAALVATSRVVYMVRFRLQASYMKDKDDFPIYYLVVPCLVLALLIRPWTPYKIFNYGWAFCVYLEAVSVLPQRRLMRSAMIVKPFMAPYVFALWVARILSWMHWVLQAVDTPGGLLTMLGCGLWPYTFLLAEAVQTLVLADFCYYYVKSLLDRQPRMIRLPSYAV